MIHVSSNSIISGIKLYHALSSKICTCSKILPYLVKKNALNVRNKSERPNYNMSEFSIYLKLKS